MAAARTVALLALLALGAHSMDFTHSLFVNETTSKPCLWFAFDNLTATDGAFMPLRAARAANTNGRMEVAEGMMMVGTGGISTERRKKRKKGNIMHGAQTGSEQARERERERERSELWGTKEARVVRGRRGAGDLGAHVGDCRCSNTPVPRPQHSSYHSCFRQ